MANGFFLGGAAEGIGQANKLALADRAQQAKEQENLIANAESQIQATMGQISEVVKAATAAGQSPDTVLQSGAVQALLSQAQGIAARIGRDPAQLTQMVDVMRLRPVSPDATPKPVSELGKVESDVQRGFVKPEVAEALMAQRTGQTKEQQLTRSDLSKPASELTPAQLAAGIAGGRFVVSIHPMTGERQVLDLASGKIVGAAQPAQQTPVAQTDISPTGETKDTFDSRFQGEQAPDVSQAVGFKGKLMNAINTIADIPGLRVPFKEALDAESKLNLLATTTTALMQEAVPGRPSAFLLKMLEELSVRPNSIFVGDERAISRLKAIRGHLAAEVARMDEQVIKQRDKWDKKEYQKYNSNFNSLKSLLKSYNAVIDAFGGVAPEDRPPFETFIGKKK